MYNLSNFCSLCLTPCKNTTPFTSINLSAREILEFIIPDIELESSEAPKQTCDVCLNNLNSIFIFKQRCIKNLISFNAYVEKLKKSAPDKYLSIDINSITQNSASEISDFEIEPTSYKSDNLDIETVTIKIENIDDDFFMDEESDVDEEVVKNEDISSDKNRLEDISLEKDNITLDTESKFTTEKNNDRLVFEDCTASNNTNENDDLEEIEEDADSSCYTILPEKSKERYKFTYSSFKTWCVKMNIDNISDEVMLKYFLDRSNVMKCSSSLWCEYSMLRATIMLNDSIDISFFQKLRSFLRDKSVGYRPRKTRNFTREQIIKFITKAPDEIYLMKKVVAIMGVAGACRRHELCKMTVDDIEDKGSAIIVTISRHNFPRSFAIQNDEKQNFFCLDVCRKYFSLRPKDMENKRLFIKYQKGRCFRQAVGKNTFGKIPSEIAKFLKLDDIQGYTGNSLRKTYSALLANSGINIAGLRKYGSWIFSSEM